MNNYYIKKVLERHEFNTIKKIEKNLDGYGEWCWKALERDLSECIEARKEVNYLPLFISITDLLIHYSYDDEFINEFTERVKNDDENSGNCPGW